MSFQETSEMHKRRGNRNLSVALCLVGFMGLIVALTIVKWQSGGTLEGYDHAPRNSITVEEGS